MFLTYRNPLSHIFLSLVLYVSHASYRIPIGGLIVMKIIVKIDTYYSCAECTKRVQQLFIQTFNEIQNELLNFKERYGENDAIKQ